MTKSEDLQMQGFLKGIVGVVEATSYERHALWEDYHQREGRTWVSGTSGYLETVGKFGGMPTCISLLVDVVDGHRLLFWHATSQVVDHRLIEAWMDSAIPPSARESDGRINRTDAMNFCNVLFSAKQRSAREVENA